jgi:hypothetical protein
MLPRSLPTPPSLLEDQTGGADDRAGRSLGGTTIVNNLNARVDVRTTDATGFRRNKNQIAGDVMRALRAGGR